MSKFLILTGLVCILFSQTANQFNLSITTHSIKSKILNEERSFHIYLPDNYDKRTDRFDVLYILDGQWYFLNGVAIQKSLRAPDVLPEMIIVGVQNKNPRRRTLFGRVDDFLKHMKNELIPYIDTTFRTSSRRVLFGWEMSGIFATQAIFDSGNLFEGSISTNGAYIDTIRTKKFIESANDVKKYLYIANSEKDVYSIDYTKSSSRFLERNPSKNINWKFELFNTETHESLAYIALYHGLRYFYHYYGDFTISSFEDFEKQGGMAFLNEFNKNRHERFGVPNIIDDNTKNHLIWIAWKRDKYDYFDFFMTEFKDVLNTKRYASTYWQHRLGQFYLKHGNLEKAEHHFKLALNKFDPRDDVYYGLSLISKERKDYKDAVKYIEKAIEFAELKKRPSLDIYKKELNDLRGKL